MHQQPDHGGAYHQQRKHADRRRRHDQAVMPVDERTGPPGLHSVTRASAYSYRMAGRAGEHVEDRDYQRGGARCRSPSWQASRVAGLATDRQVGHERVEFPIGPGCIQRFEPLFELVGADPALAGGTP